MDRHDILAAAMEAVRERGTRYGNAEASGEDVAAIWSAYLRRKLVEPISAREVYWMMAMLKAVRSNSSPDDPDHYIDGAGYPALAGEVSLRRGDKEG